MDSLRDDPANSPLEDPEHAGDAHQRQRGGPVAVPIPNIQLTTGGAAGTNPQRARRIILVGKTGVGKSNLGNVLLGSELLDPAQPENARRRFVAKSSVFSVTEGAEELIGELNSTENPGAAIPIHVIDTVGLVGFKPRPSPDQPNAPVAKHKSLLCIMKELGEFLRANNRSDTAEDPCAGRVDLLIVVYNNNNRITPEEAEVISQLQRFFRQVSPITMMVVTHCESPEDCDRVKREMQSVGEKSLREFIQTVISEDPENALRGHGMICCDLPNAVNPELTAKRRRINKAILCGDEGDVGEAPKLRDAVYRVLVDGYRQSRSRACRTDKRPIKSALPLVKEKQLDGVLIYKLLDQCKLPFV